MDIDLTGKQAIIGGASKGIGLATAKELARLGACVTLLARNQEQLIVAHHQLKEISDQQHHIIAIDFNDSHALKRCLSDHIDKHGAFHILINNSGGPKPNLLQTTEIEDFISAFSQHVIASHIMSQLLLPGMKQEKYGRIINILSTSVKQPISGLGVSNTIRGAMANWSKTLAGEVACDGITVNNILPGATETERLTEIIRTKARQQDSSPEQIALHELSTIPARRFGTPYEIAQAVAFLASPAAAYINGINLTIDGGRTSCL